MRLPLVAALACAVTQVSAGGYQGCLERVHLFQAYEIDGLMQPGDRLLGFRCPDWNNDNHKCNGNYEACAGSRNGGRCTFDELMDHMRSANDRQNWGQGIYQANGRIDAERTAIACYNRYQGGQGNTKRPVPNFPPFRAMRGDVWEFNDYLRRLGDRVDFIYHKQSSAANKELFEDFDGTREKISVARAGDHGPELLERANDDQNGLRGAVYAKDVGRNPVTGGNFMTVDWPETIRRGIANGDDNMRDHTNAWLRNFYQGGAARQHLMVFRSYKYMQNRARKCGRR